MSFDTSNLRTILHLDYELNIRQMPTNPLILIKNNVVRFANTRTEKDQLVAEYDEATDLLLFAWAGQYRTDVFHLRKSDLDRHYQKPKSPEK